MEEGDGVPQSFEFLLYESVKYFSKQTENLFDGHVTCARLMENLAYRVSQQLIEKMTKNLMKFQSELDIVKYICKDFWTYIFRKPISSLKTNNQELYVLTDSAFFFLNRVDPSQQYSPLMEMLLAFPCGLLRGALTSLGVKCIVKAEIPQLPACQFTISVLPRLKSTEG
uniref:Trafficking protein particle complex subunit 6B n=2 Tax=Schistocephalus solidus TaxID=70667 RepID=A0A0X3Q059_SCHSO